MLTRKFHFYLMPSDGASGDGPGAGGGGPGGGGGGGGNRGGKHGQSPGALGGRSKGKGKGSVSGATRGNISSKTGRSKSKGSVSGATRGNISAKTAPAPGSLAARQAAVDAANAKRAANPAPTTGISIDVRSKDIMGPPSSLANSNSSVSGATRGNISAKVDPSRNAVNSAFAKLGDGFRQMAIETFGAEPGIEGYSEDGDYGYGYNSEYGQQLRAGNPNVRAKGNLSLAQQQAKAADYTEPGLFDNFSIDTDGFFDGLGQKFGGFVLGRVGMALGGTFGPVGAILGGVLGNYIGKNMVGGDKEGEEGDDGKSSGIFGGLFSEGGLFSGTGYQASASDLGPGGAGESKPDDDDKGIFANHVVGDAGGGSAGNKKDGDIIVPDGDADDPDLTLEEYLKSLETDRAEAFANVRLQQRQSLALQRISSRRYALGTSYRV